MGSSAVRVWVLTWEGSSCFPLQYVCMDATLKNHVIGVTSWLPIIPRAAPGSEREAGLRSVLTKAEEELESTSPTSTLWLLASITIFFFSKTGWPSSQTTHFKDKPCCWWSLSRSCIACLSLRGVGTPALTSAFEQPSAQRAVLHHRFCPACSRAAGCCSHVPQADWKSQGWQRPYQPTCPPCWSPSEGASGVGVHSRRALRGSGLIALLLGAGELLCGVVPVLCNTQGAACLLPNPSRRAFRRLPPKAVTTCSSLLSKGKAPQYTREGKDTSRWAPLNSPLVASESVNLNKAASAATYRQCTMNLRTALQTPLETAFLH